MAYTVGSPLTGTITATVGSASLFANSGFTSPGGTTSTNGLTLSNFKGSYDLASNALSLSAAGAHLGLGKIVSADATNVAIAYDPTAASPVTVTAGSLTATSPLLSGVTGTITNLAASSTGVSFDNATLTDPSTLSLGGVFQVTGATVGISGFDYSAGSGAVLGSISVGSASASLFPGKSTFSTTVKNFNGSYNLTNNALTLQADEVDLNFGKVLAATATGVNIGWDGTNASVDLATLTATSPLLPGVSGSVTGFHADNTGFTIASAQLGDTGAITLDKILEVDNSSVTAAKLAYSTGTGTLTGSVGLSFDGAKLFPGATGFSTTVTGFAGTYNLATQATSFGAAEIDVNFGKVLQATAINPTIGWDGTTASVSLPSLTATSPLLTGVTGTVTGFQASDAGFSITSASLSDTGAITLGKILEVDNSAVSTTGLSYSTGTGALSGSIGLAFGGAKLFPGSSSFNATVTGFTGSYNLATQATSFSASEVDLNFGKVLKATATGVNIGLGRHQRQRCAGDDDGHIAAVAGRDGHHHQLPGQQRRLQPGQRFAERYRRDHAR